MSVIFKTERLSLKIGSLQLKLDVIQNIDELFNELVSRPDDDPEVKDERIPYWAELWPSAVVLSEYLVSNGSLLKGKAVLEVGCGLGLSGIVAGMLGGNVVMTDYQNAALDFAAANWRLNNDTPVKTEILDWRSPGKTEKVDLILASDVAYESKVFRFLISTFKKLLRPTGTILLTEPNRKFAKDLISQLLKAGFTVQSETIHKQFQGVKHVVHLHRIQFAVSQLSVG